MTPLRVLVVDDEELARATLVRLLAADPEVQVVGQAASARDAAPLIAGADLAFLDIQMPGGDGFDLVGRGGAGPAIVFVTAHDDHALRAFEVAAVDYLLKPFDDERFALALERAKAHIRRGRAEELARHLGALGAGAPPERLAIKDGARLRFVRVADIDWIGAEDYYAELHIGGAAHLLREPLRDLEARLDGHRFVRIHRSTIVNLERVREIETSARGDWAVVLADGTRLRLSRSRRAALYARLGVGGLGSLQD